MTAADLATAMMTLHDELAETFFAHQQALLDRDFALAERELLRYREDLFAHAADEERLVLPRYEALGGDATDAPVRLFLFEHDKLLAFVDEFVVRTRALVASRSDRALLELFDREATFKNLVLHHDLRERNALYPFLAARLDAAAQRSVLAERAFGGS